MPALLAAASSSLSPGLINFLVYAGFIAFVLVMLAIDLFVVNRKPHDISVKAALMWTGVCVVMALLFNVLVYFMYESHWLELGLNNKGEVIAGGWQAATEFFQGWLLEYSLSVDNLFVIAVIFGHFKVPSMYQHRVLFWGILGALILRGVMIAAGAELVGRFHWMIYAFGALLVFTAWRMLVSKEADFDPERSLAVRLARKVFPVHPSLDGQKFFTRAGGTLAMTPLFLVLVVVETTDVLFAVDSIPAIFGVTMDPFLVFTSNVFAILGLRSLYFALSDILDRFHYLKISLVVVLAFIGVKMLLSGIFHIDSRLSLAVVVGVIITGVLASLAVPAKNKEPKP